MQKKQRKKVIVISKQNLDDFIDRYNNTWHRAIKRAPNEAWMNPDEIELKRSNTNSGEYAKEYKMGHREKFKKGMEVAIRQQEVLGNPKWKHRYDLTGKVVGQLENGTYVVNQNGRIFKKSHAQLKEIK